jgi:uncharacterized protein
MPFSNRLAKETSPYLLQHAHNPVDWYPWGEEALQKAQTEDMPILVSIGYSSCHWCHVMEKESFENSATAQLMNKHFINIKIDREERPDLDHIYMDALQAMTGSGGWPLNVFLTPQLKPFYGGTYFPPVKAYNIASWNDVLVSISKAFKERRSEIEEQANELLNHIKNANSFGLQKPSLLHLPADELFTSKQAEEMFENIMKTADTEWGGFGKAPKFPQTFTIRFLLQYHHATGNEKALKQAFISLDKMINGGIYDHIGGGFARYSTDNEWLAPHFEKMLYDNALLVVALCDAYQVTKNNKYKKTIEETLQFIDDEMTSEEAGFFSAYDADSEGVEGKFYTWKKSEVDAVLQNDSELFCSFYDISEKGNWEGVNIPRIKIEAEAFCELHQLNIDFFNSTMANCRNKLFETRSRRIKPLLDDKIILSWNALMNMAYSKAYAALGKEEFKERAVQNMTFLLKTFKVETKDGFNHVYTKGETKFNAYLDDYAFLIQALISLQEITSNQQYLKWAEEFTQIVLTHFAEEETGFFYFTEDGQKDIIVRKKEVYDGAIPSGNAIMVCNLHYLGVILNKPAWKEQSMKMILSLEKAVLKYPGSFGVWVGHLMNMIYGFNEVAIVGYDHQKYRDELLKEFLPGTILQSASKSIQEFPLLAGRSTENKNSYIYVCRDYRCLKPTTNTLEALSFLRDRPFIQ